MIDREKVILGLECCIKRDPDDKMRCGECPYDGACLNRLKADALALLRVQAPRVMTLGEIRNWVNSDRVAREPVVIEMRGGICAWIIDDEVRELPGEENLSSDLYGKTWRYWTSCPTDEQREAEPW